MRLKSDFFSIFLSFKKLVEHQLDSGIKIFQSDGDGEFTSNQFIQYLASCGIKHHMSSPHTPQKIGVTERKHRHVTELGLSLMFQSKVPQQLWVEAFLTTVYLMNLLPASTLPDNISLYKALVGRPPVYTSLRVFESSCYPFLRPYGKNKFVPQSLHCVFLGYSEKHKAYRCLHPPTTRVYINRHVIFDESTFLYQTIYLQFLHSAETPLLKAWRSEFVYPSPEVSSSMEEEDIIHVR